MTWSATRRAPPPGFGGPAGREGLELRQILSRHQGTLSNYAGDAFFATWEAGGTSGAGPPGLAQQAARAAVAFAIEAAAAVPRVAAGLELRDPGGGLLRMGWVSHSGGRR